VTDRDGYRRRVDLETERPWGRYDVLADASTYKVKAITVEPGRRLSYQRHAQRSEHWFVVHGTARVITDGQERTLGPGAAVDVPKGTAHRIENVGTDPLVFVEVQTGDYFGEDDIVRLEDDFGRVS
jgi:mannose-6-phosphate isomerase-like protein (cupin superfamily)